MISPVNKNDDWGGRFAVAHQKNRGGLIVLFVG